MSVSLLFGRNFGRGIFDFDDAFVGLLLTIFTFIGTGGRFDLCRVQACGIAAGEGRGRGGRVIAKRCRRFAGETLRAETAIVGRVCSERDGQQAKDQG